MSVYRLWRRLRRGHWELICVNNAAHPTRDDGARIYWERVAACRNHGFYSLFVLSCEEW